MINWIPKQSPRGKASYYEYAVESGGTVLSHKRYDNAEAANWDRILKNNTDRDRTGRVLAKRRVVKRKVTIGDWKPVDVDKEIKRLWEQRKKGKDK